MPAVKMAAGIGFTRVWTFVLLVTVQLLFLSRVAADYAASPLRTFRSGPPNATLPLPSSGAGPSYATACNNAWLSYRSASSSYVAANAKAYTQTNKYGGSFTSWFTYYANASTLCDGVARLTQSPAVSLSTGVKTGYVPITATSTYTYSMWYGDAGPSPTCSISPSDCDPLWSAYSSSLMRGNLSRVSGVALPTLTASPMTPFCMNRTAASAQSSADAIITACGPCTIFGNEVQLIFFPVPTTVPRDMCASTPKASKTHYADDAIIEAFAGFSYSGKGERAKNATTAVVGEHTFTSGTAYISIATVWAADRCGVHQGSVRDAILAMPSSSVLSLRYSQDHFQYFMLTDTQTGYPVSYADFNTPIPWSAWNGQAICRGAYVGYPCSVIYENQYRPQLAIPPGIRQLHPEWSTCQMWYGGLYDPPLALQPQQSIERPSVPSWQSGYGSSLLFPTTTTSAGLNEEIFTRPPVPGSTSASTAVETGISQVYGQANSKGILQSGQSTIRVAKSMDGNGDGAVTLVTEVVTRIQQVAPTPAGDPDESSEGEFGGENVSSSAFPVRISLPSASVTTTSDEKQVDISSSARIRPTSNPMKSVAANGKTFNKLWHLLISALSIMLIP